MSNINEHFITRINIIEDIQYSKRCIIRKGRGWLEFVHTNFNINYIKCPFGRDVKQAWTTMHGIN